MAKGKISMDDALRRHVIGKKFAPEITSFSIKRNYKE